MPKTVSMEIPQKWLEGIPDEPAVIRQIIALGIRQYKMDQALKLYKSGGVHRICSRIISSAKERFSPGGTKKRPGTRVYGRNSFRGTWFVKGVVISNAGPLIVLAKLNQLHLLRELYGQVYFSSALYHEVVTVGLKNGYDDAKTLKPFLTRKGGLLPIQGNCQMK